MPDNQSGVPKALAIMTAGMLLGLGLCGITRWGGGDSTVLSFAILGAGLFFFCLIGILLTSLVLLITKIMEMFRR